MSPSEKLAQHVVQQCLEIGVREFVVCSGSRNSPLILEVLRSPVQVWSFFDERSAAFFALGRSQALDAPVAILTTSGTAVAELYPAVIEATYLRVPILCITADRPKAFRNSGAPQAIEQAGIFCMYARDSWDVDDSDFDLNRWDGWGPAHLNVCFDEPLLTLDEKAPGIPPKSDSPRREKSPGPAPFIPRQLYAHPDLVLLGSLPPNVRASVCQVLAQIGAPILADATSGLREAPELQPWMLRSGESVVDRDELSQVLRIGGVPSFRTWRDLENEPSTEVISVLNKGFSGLARKSLIAESLEAIQFAEPREHQLLKRDRNREPALLKSFGQFPQSEPSLVRLISRQIPEAATVFLGNSLPIREWNLAADHEHKLANAWANRGANGIDGNLSTFLGLAAESSESWAIVGDLTALYDLSAPWILPALPKTKRRIVVLNNGGGRIFSRLPILRDLPEGSKKTTENRHHVGLEHWAKMWGLGYRRVDSPDFPARLPKEVVIEVFPDSDQTERFWEAYQTLSTR